jgi:putative transcriptional regulator
MGRKDTFSSSGKGKGRGQCPPLAGSLLVAHPSLNAGVFRRSVILLPSHDENGAMGIVLNQPLHKRVGEVCGEFAFSSLSEVPVFSGGPVGADKLMFCAWRMHEMGCGVGLQLMFGIDPEKAMAMQYESGTRLRAFFGHAGWEPGQLEKEMRQDTWVVAPLLPGLLEEADAGSGDALWRGILGKLGAHWSVMAGEPDDPGVN